MAEVKRLYEFIEPKSYQLYIKPDYQSWSFQGSVELQATLRNDSKTITLHSADLGISSARVGSKEMEVSYNPEEQEVSLTAPQTIKSGGITLYLEFGGSIKDNMQGLYRSHFTHKGEEKYLLATQLEANHAREVFPCIDEPEAKAVFDLSVEIPQGLTVVSNTQIAEQNRKDDAGTTIHEFKSTPVMPTYLLAFVAGELEFAQDKTKDGVEINVYTTPGNLPHTGFALDTAVKALEFYNDYFEIPYPLDKCDLIALPDFAAAAMENWGCITFRESCLLVDEKNTALHNKQFTAEVISHELAHQWFGNLVTMQWWNDLWLNEGFATWIANLAVDNIYPEWKVWEQSAVKEQMTALRLDSLQNSHPVEVPINDPREINEIFDAISYKKGAAAIHMLHEYLGKESFRQGLCLYLSRHAYQNTVTSDLWNALSEISKKPVEDFMSSWTQQTGYPLLSYRRTKQGLRLEQTRFRLLTDDTPNTEQVWQVPVSLVDDDEMFLLNKPLDEWSVTPPEPLKLNADQNGFYRTQYEKEDLKKINDNLYTFSALDRLGIINDAFELSKAGYTKTIDSLELLQDIEREERDVVWDVVYAQLVHLQRVFGEDILQQLYGEGLIDTQLQRLGWDKHAEESSFDSLLRPTIIALGGRCKSDSIIKESFRRFRGKDSIDPDIRRVVYTIVARNGDEKEYEEIKDLYEKAGTDEEKERLANALCFFQQENLIQETLSMITTDKVRKHEVPHWIAYLFTNPHAKELAWQWMQDNWQWLEDNFKDGLSFPSFPKYAAMSFSDSKKADEFESFFRGKVPDRSLNQAIETVRIQANWLNRDGQGLQGLTLKS